LAVSNHMYVSSKGKKNVIADLILFVLYYGIT